MLRNPKSTDQSPVKKVPVIGIPQNNQACKFPHRKCGLSCVENYDYCIKHILEDKSSPYKPCPYIYTVSGKKCGKAVYRPDRKDTWFCPEHSRKAHLVRQKATIKHAPPVTPESLLATLKHYAPAATSSGVKKEKNETEFTSTSSSSQAVNPFVDIDAASVNARSSQVLDYASESDSDVEPSMLDSVWRAQDHESSDAESVDSQAEDPLKHAGVYTAEEVTNVIRDKMIRLQSLYIDQFRRLHHLLKERRRKYLHALKKEKETLCSIHAQDKSSAKEQKLYQKLKALNHYHRYYGVEAVLHKKSLERRAQATEGHVVRSSHKGKCAFTEGGVKCGAKTLPVTKYCKKHILEDGQQVLFRACGYTRDDHVCQEPTVNVFEHATCVYHITLPSQPHTTLDMTETKDCKAEGESIPNSQDETLTDQEGICSSQSDPLRVPDIDMLKTELSSTLLPPSELPSNEPKQEELTSQCIDDVVKPAEEEIVTSTLDPTNETIMPTTDSETKENIVPTVIEPCEEFMETSTIEPTNETAEVTSLESTVETMETSTIEPTNIPIESTAMELTETTLGNADCKMKIVPEPDVMGPPTSENLPAKEENKEELVMVDMTDVGVVEEVLELENTGDKMEVDETTEISDDVENSEKSDDFENAEKSDNIENAEKSDNVENTEKPDVVENTEKSDDIENTEKSDNVENTEKPDNVENTERADNVDTTV